MGRPVSTGMTNTAAQRKLHQNPQDTGTEGQPGTGVFQFPAYTRSKFSATELLPQSELSMSVVLNLPNAEYSYSWYGDCNHRITSLELGSTHL